MPVVAVEVVRSDEPLGRGESGEAEMAWGGKTMEQF